MDLLRPATWAEALAAKASCPEAVAIAGGTDVMVELNFDRRRLGLDGVLLDLTRVAEIRTWRVVDGHVELGAGVPYARVIDELADRLPALALASRTVGSPQIRNRGTVGGNLGTASPAGDAHPALLATGATVRVASRRGERTIPIDEFFVGPKRSALAPDELIRHVTVPVAAGPQQFSKIGTRNAMVIAVAAFAVALDPATRAVGTGIGSAGPTPLRAGDAERFAAGELDWAGAGPLREATAREFGALVAAAARPIDDVRGSAAYRRTALAVTARRTLTWAWDEWRAEAVRCA
jgi:CO/xanthine dehydrogenase FAD-binding subunit